MYADELELSAYQVELALAINLILEREVELARELNSLIDFRNRYTSSLGVLYRDLDRINAEIFLKLAVCTPSPPYPPKCSACEDNGPQVMCANTGLIPIWGTVRKRAGKSVSLVSLFRKAAIKLHPDLSTDEQERYRRCLAMSQINSAYERGDRESIELILAEWEGNAETNVLDQIYKELTCVLRQLALARKRLAQLDGELADVKSSQWHILCQKEKELKAKGKDLIQMLSLDAKREIAQAQKVLKSLEGKSVV